MEVCSCISQHTKDFPWEYGKNNKEHAEYIKKLRQAVAIAVEYDGFATFYCGLTNSSDLDFAEAVIYQKQYYDIKLVCVVSKQNQCQGWNQKDIERYKSILIEADSHRTVAKPIYKYLIDRAKQIIFVWNEALLSDVSIYINYTIQKKKFTYFVRLNDIKANTD